LLEEAGADVIYNDPHVPVVHFEHELYMKENKHEYRSQELTAELLKSVDCVLVAVAHSAYDFEFIAKQAKLVFDLVNGTKKVSAPHIYKL
jgi:UDP-N-acetyl-D-glucosamine dehydrogenase